jgi:hypothetical protein
MLLNSVESQFFDVCHISSALDSPWLSNTRATEKDMFRKPGHPFSRQRLLLTVPQPTGMCCRSKIYIP